MALRLFLSATVASLVMIGCPVTEPPGPSRAPLSGVAPMPAAVQVLPPPATTARGPEARQQKAKKPRRSRQASRRTSEPPPPPVEVPEGLALHQDLVAGRILGALSKETVVRAEPRPDARKLRFLRQGALVRREPQAAGN